MKREKERRIKRLLRGNKRKEDVWKEKELKRLKELVEKHVIFLDKNNYVPDAEVSENVIFSVPENLDEFFRNYILLKYIKRLIEKKPEILDKWCKETICKKRLPFLVSELVEKYDDALKVFYDSLFYPLLGISSLFLSFLEVLRETWKKYIVNSEVASYIDGFFSEKKNVLMERLDYVSGSSWGNRLLPFKNMVLAVFTVKKPNGDIDVRAITWFVDKNYEKIFNDPFLDYFEEFDAWKLDHVFIFTDPSEVKEYDYYGYKSLRTLYINNEIKNYYLKIIEKLMDLLQKTGRSKRTSINDFHELSEPIDVYIKLRDLLDVVFVKNGFVIFDENGERKGWVTDYVVSLNDEEKIVFSLYLDNGEKMQIMYDPFDDILQQITEILNEYSATGLNDFLVTVALNVIKYLDDEKRKEIFLKLIDSEAFYGKTFNGKTYKCGSFLANDGKSYYICFSGE